MTSRSELIIRRTIIVLLEAWLLTTGHWGYATAIAVFCWLEAAA